MKQFLHLQLLTFVLGEESNISTRQLLTFLLGKEAILPWQLLTFLLGKEAILHRQLLTFLLGKEAVPPRLLLIFPLGKQAVLPRQLLTFPQEEGNSSPQSTTYPSLGEGSGKSQAGQTSNQARSGRQGFRHSTRYRTPQTSQENSALPPRQAVLTPARVTPPLPPPVGFPKCLLMKNLTLSGSLTYPANL